MHYNIILYAFVYYKRNILQFELLLLITAVETFIDQL